MPAGLQYEVEPVPKKTGGIRQRLRSFLEDQALLFAMLLEGGEINEDTFIRMREATIRPQTLFKRETDLSGPETL